MSWKLLCVICCKARPDVVEHEHPPFTVCPDCEPKAREMRTVTGATRRLTGSWPKFPVLRDLYDDLRRTVPDNKLPPKKPQNEDPLEKPEIDAKEPKLL